MINLLGVVQPIHIHIHIHVQVAGYQRGQIRLRNDIHKTRLSNALIRDFRRTLWAD